MLYFREKELGILDRFNNTDGHKACAVYGRRRTGKTELLLTYIREHYSGHSVYYQCTGYDYSTCLGDFKSALQAEFPGDSILDSLNTFKDVFTYIEKVSRNSLLIVIDEFPFLCKRNDDVVVEFQWIIDHALGSSKLVLLGSNLSFMKRQINEQESPLYGRFSEIIEVRPFTFDEVHQLFKNFEDAVDVYAQTGGVAQYVMMFSEFGSVREATDALFMDRDGRLFQEAHNLLMQELRDITTYVSILRVLALGEKDSGQIASKAGIDPRGIFSYMAKLMDLEIVTTVENAFSRKKHDRRYRIKDNMFRFSYAFIEPNISMINSIGPKAGPYILNDAYKEYLGFVYEDIIRDACFEYALQKRIPFMPITVGKWWGNVKDKKGWHESEVDLIAFDDKNVIIGECKFRNKLVGISELDKLKTKAQFIPLGDRTVYYLLASKSGFTNEVKDRDVILIEKA